MNGQPNNHQNTPQANNLVIVDAAQSFFTPMTTAEQLFNDSEKSFHTPDYLDNFVSNVQSTEHHLNNDLKLTSFDNTPDVQAYTFESDTNPEVFSIDSHHNLTDELRIYKESFDNNEFDIIIKNLGKNLQYLEAKCKRVQQITRNFHNQLVYIKHLGMKLSHFCQICRSLIVLALNIQQNTDIFTYHEFQMLTLYAPESSSNTTDVAEILLDQQSSQSNENSVDNYKRRLEFSRSVMELFKQATKFQIQIATLNSVLTKSVLSKTECFNEIEQSLRLPSSIFSKDSNYERYLYELTTTNTKKQNVYVRCIRGQLAYDDIHITCTEHFKHILSQTNYNACEKYSYIYDIEFKCAITPMDQLTIAIPCFTLPYELQSTNSLHSTQSLQQQIFIRCKRIMDPLIHIPTIIETYEDVSYAVFRITHSLSAISVEAALFYPYEVLNVTHHNSSSIYTSRHMTTFRIETPKNYFIRSPRVRIIPFSNDLMQCMTAFKSEDQLLALSDLIEFEWYRDAKAEGIISITVQLTWRLNVLNETTDDLRNRRRKAQQKISVQRKKFEQDKYDEAGGSLTTTPVSASNLSPSAVMQHLPSIAAVIDRVKIDQKEGTMKAQLNIDRQNPDPSMSLKKSPFNWSLDGFQNDNAPIILFGYKNRKWKNCNNYATITRTSSKDVYVIALTTLLDRIIVVRCWPESSHEGKFDKLPENLWSLTSAKLFSCVLARDPSFTNSSGHYALMIVPVQMQRSAEEILRKRNYTEYIYDESLSHESNSKTQLSRIDQYPSHHSLLDQSSLSYQGRYVQYCFYEGTYVRIIPSGNIDIHEKSDLSFRLHAQYPIIIEFDIYPIDIYRQKTDDDFIGILNICEVNLHHATIGSANSTLTAAAVSSRTSSDSKNIETFDGLANNSSPRMSTSAPETNSTVGFASRAAFEKLTVRNINEQSVLCTIRIRLPKAVFQLPAIQSSTASFDIPSAFMKVLETLTEDKLELAEALRIHPSLMNSLVSSTRSQKQKNAIHSLSSTSLHEHSRTNLNREQEPTKSENETLLKWLKRQNAFKIRQTLDNIISALIRIGRVDLAYMFKIDNLIYKCQHS